MRCHLWPLRYKQISLTQRPWLPGCHQECRASNLVMKVVESGKNRWIYLIRFKHKWIRDIMWDIDVEFVSLFAWEHQATFMPKPTF